MPRLKGYTADLTATPISGGRRAEGSDLAPGGLVEVGREIRGAIEKQVEATELAEQRRVLVEQAKIRQQTGKELEEAELSDADVDKIRERLESNLSAVGETLATKRGAEAAAVHSANTLNIFDSAVNQIKVRRATVEARTQSREFIAAQGGLVTSSPSYLGVATKEVDSFMETFKGRVPPEQLAEMASGLKQQLNVSAVRALSKLTPESVVERLNRGEFDLSPDQRADEITRAEQQVKAQQADAARVRADEEYNRRKLSEDAQDLWFKDIVAGKARETDIVGDERLTTRDRQHTVALLRAETARKMGQDRAPNATAERNLMLRIYAPEGDPQKIYTNDAVYAALASSDPREQINSEQFTRLTSHAANARDPNNSTVNSRFNEAMRRFSEGANQDHYLKVVPGGAAEASLAWAAAVRTRMDEERNASPPRNPARLFEPGHKDSVVTAEFMAPFILDARRRGKASIAAEAQAAGGVVDLRATPDVVSTIDVGAQFVDPRGVTRVMTQQLKDALAQESSPSGQAPVSTKDLSPHAKAYARAHPLIALPTRVYGGVEVSIGMADDEPLSVRIERVNQKKSYENYSEYAARIHSLVKKAREGGAE